MKTIENEWDWCKRGVIVAKDAAGVCLVDIAKHDNHYCLVGEAYLWNLVVTEEHRRKGVASSLLEQGEQYARGHGCKRITLTWDAADTKPWVLEWYERKGYTVTGKRETELLLEKQL